jgi:phage baseplate assembly protein W
MGLGSAIVSNFTGAGGLRGSRPEVLGTDIIGVPGELGGFGAGAYGPLRVPAKYYLEIRANNSFAYMVSLPYDPQVVEITRQTPTRLTQTLGGTLREFAPQRKHMIILKGRSGLAERVAYNRNGGITFQDGKTVFTEFDEFLKGYNETNSILYEFTANTMNTQAPLTNTKSFVNQINTFHDAPKGTHMVLRCIDEDAHFRVEPVSFNYSRNAETNRFDFTYQLVLEAYDYAYDSKTYNPIMAAFDIVDNIVGLGGGFVGLATNLVNNVSNDYVRGFSDAIQSVGKIVDATNELAISFGGLGDSFSYLATGFCDTVDKFATAGDAWKNLAGHWADDDIPPGRRPFEPIEEEEQDEANAEAAQLEEQSLELKIIEQYSYSVEPPDNVDEETLLLLSNIQSVENSIKNLAKVTRGGIKQSFYKNYLKDIKEDYKNGKFLANEKNFEFLSILNQEKQNTVGNNVTNPDIKGIEIVLGRDEDLRKVAQKFLKDGSLAPELVAYNSWTDERRRPDGAFAQGGERIIIPDSLIENINPFDEKSAISSDISCLTDDLEFDLSNNELKLTTPSETLRQTLKNILLTNEGEMTLSPQFGVPQIVKTDFDPALTGALIRESIIAHDYYVDVTDIFTDVKADKLEVSCTVTCINGERIPLKTPGQL